MKKSVTIIFLGTLILSGVFFVSSARAANDAYSTWQSITVNTTVGSFPVSIISIDLRHPRLQIKSLTTVSGERLNQAGPTQSLQSYVDQVNGFTGVNGCYFCPADYTSCSGVEGSYYWMWFNSLTGEFSNAYQNQFNQGPVIAFGADNSIYYYRVGEDWPGKEEFESINNTILQAAISNGPGLIYAGQFVVSEDQLDDKQRTVKSNRSGIGFKDNHVYLAVASNATVMDLGYIMQALGMEYAMNLDGGGSSALYYDGQYKVGPGRNIPNALVFIETSEPTALAVNGYSFFAYDSQIRGGYYVSSGNVMGDLKDEIIVGTGKGIAPQVRIFNNSADVLAQFYAYDSNLRNGVTVAACDVNGDGFDEIITAQGSGGWPVVKIFDGYGSVINNGFSVLDGEFSGGVNLSCGDTNGDGISEIVVAAQRGGGPHVLVYNAEGRILTNFMAYDSSFRGGINIGTLDMDGDGRDEIVTGPQYGAPHVQIFQIRPDELKRLSPGFYAFDLDYRGGVAVAGVDTDGDGSRELLVSVGSEAQPLVKRYNIQEQLQGQFYAYGTNFLGGVQVNGGDVNGDGTDEILVVPRSAGGPNVRIIEAGDL